MSGEHHLYQVEDGWCELGDGTAFYFGAEPEVLADSIEPWSIAMALSKLCRYNGHTRRFYSVAEHTILMADYVEKVLKLGPRECLTALHHDDSEGLVLGDLPRPVKVKMPQFKALEDRHDKAISIRFNTIHPLPSFVKDLDARILNDERRKVMRKSPHSWGVDSLEPMGIRPWFIRGRFSRLVAHEWLKRHNRWTRMMEAELSPAKPALVANLDEYRGV